MRISVIGTGNLAVHLIHAFEMCDHIDCVQWVGRKESSPLKSSKTPYFTEYQKRIKADLCLIAVSDDHINEVAQQLQISDILVVHTSGAVAMHALDPIARKGVFYPLQSFLHNVSIDWSTVPICVESSNKSDENLLKTFATLLSEHVYLVSESQRLELHTAAVFANNFCNHILGISQKIIENSALPFSILHPLIKETFERSLTQSTFKVQTGPAVRNDTKTQEKHLTLLPKQEGTLYKILTKSIFNTHNT